MTSSTNADDSQSVGEELADRENDGALANPDRLDSVHLEYWKLEKAWLNSDAWRIARRRLRFRLISPGLGFALAVALFVLGWVRQDPNDFGFDSNGQSTPLLFFVFALSLASLSIFGVVSFYRQFRLERQAFLEYRERNQTILAVEEAVKKVEESLEFEDLYALNRRLMDDYHSLTKSQAERAFINSQAAMAVGLLVFAVGVMLVVLLPSAAAKISAAGLASVGSGMAGYITNTFLKSQHLATRQLNSFFRQPPVNSYLLEAERIAEKLEPEARGEALRDIEPFSSWSGCVGR